MNDRHIVLVGMMGCGKSSVGRKLARLARMPLFDTDTWVEEIAGCSCMDIFTRHGEAEFRRLEEEAVKHVSTLPPSIVATGGGTIQNPANREILWQYGMVFYLEASIDTLFYRATRRPTRPLLQKENPREVIEELMASRQNLYAQAHHTIDVNQLGTEEIAHAIRRLYHSQTAGKS